MLSVKMVLTGKYAGETVKMHGKQFTNGVVLVRAANKQDLEPQMRWLERMCQAFAEGSQALKDAQDHWETINGVQHKVHMPPEQRNSAGVGSGQPSAAGGVPENAPANRDGVITNGPAPGDEGLRSNRSGHEHTGLRPEQMTAIRKALSDLDPLNDSHWTDSGLPSVEVVANVVADQTVSREVLRSVEPDFNREKALEMAAV